MLHVGDEAPDFSAPNGQDGTVKLSQYRGQKRIALFFFPKCNTSGCDMENASFRDHYAKLEAGGVLPLGISTDPPEVSSSYRADKKLPFPVLSDPQGAVAKLYGVYKESGVARRVTFYIGKDGKVESVLAAMLPLSHVSHAVEWAASPPR